MSLSSVGLRIMREEVNNIQIPRIYLTTFLTPTLLFLHFLDNQTFKFKNMLE